MATKRNLKTRKCFIRVTAVLDKPNVSDVNVTEIEIANPMNQAQQKKEEAEAAANDFMSMGNDGNDPLLNRLPV